MNTTNESLPNQAASNRTAAHTRTLLPRTDVFAGDEGAVLVCELPGVAESDVDVQLDGDVLHVSARAGWAAPENLRLVHGEFEPVRYERRFRLGDHLDRESVRATLRDGLLRIDVAPRANPARRIEVRSDKDASV